jgi:hypothetical protein
MFFEERAGERRGWQRGKEILTGISGIDDCEPVLAHVAVSEGDGVSQQAMLLEFNSERVCFFYK